jgi:hypothetical protein
MMYGWRAIRIRGSAGHVDIDALEASLGFPQILDRHALKRAPDVNLDYRRSL